MKKVLMVWWIVLLSLALVFGAVAIVLSVKKSYAENHYEQTVEMKKYAGLLSIENTLGCGEMDCKFCNGQKVGFVYREIEGNTYYYLKFVYYRNLFVFWIVSLTMMAGCTASGFVVLAKWKKVK